jgi:hypothetical protein
MNVYLLQQIKQYEDMRKKIKKRNFGWEGRELWKMMW